MTLVSRKPTTRACLAARFLRLALCVSLSFLAQSAVKTKKARKCEFGQEPGFWNVDKYVLFNETCTLQPILRAILAAQRKQASVPTSQKARVLSIGDSIDRKLISVLTEEVGQEMEYYAPMKYKTLPSGRQKPEQTGKDARVTVGPVEFANFFIFGAGDANYFSLFSEAAAIPALHNTTTERVCVDAPLYTKSFMPQGPDMLILASNFWDVARWWEQGYALSPEENLREQIVDRYLSDVERLMDNAKKCFPGASVYCWRTHPNLATDNRNKHYASKRPHVVAALNQAGREAASRKGWCLLDFDQMVEGHANERLWVPDGLHPGGFVMMQYANVVLNTLYQAKQWEVPRD